MNIFILSKNPKKCVKYMFDKHIVKIILEIVQMLCTAKRILDSDKEDELTCLYKIAHKNHPVCKWVRESKGNYLWTMELLEEMHKEWRFRYNHSETKFHKSYLIAKLIKIPENFIKEEMTEFVQAMPDIYKSDNPIKGYRNYYMSPEKRKLMSWKKRNQPAWFKPKSG